MTSRFRSRPRAVRALLAAMLASLAIAAGGLGIAAAPAPAQIAGPKPLQISIKALKFTPSKAKAKVGQTVNFVWQENVAHNIIFSKDQKSKTQSKGLWSTTFTKPGTFKYQCTLHPGMKGEVDVTK